MGDSNGRLPATPGEPERLPDSSFARRVQDGDRVAFEALAERYLRPVYAVVASFLSEPADVDDAAQETFLRALDRIHTYHPSRPFAPWLYQIARNVARSRNRSLRRWRSELLSAATPAGENLDPVAGMENEEIRRAVRAAVDRLPEQRRIAFRLFDIEGYRAEEAADLMGISAGTVRSHVHHARRALRAELEPRLGRSGER